MISHGEWGGVALFAFIGVALIALAPAKQTAHRAAAVALDTLTALLESLPDKSMCDWE